MNIIMEINNKYEKLTKKQKVIADYLLENPEDICYITLAELSEKTLSSELTILRFCYKFGFKGFTDLKDAFRSYTQNLIKRLSSSDYFVPDTTVIDEMGKVNLLKHICQEEYTNCKDFFSTIDLLSIINAAITIKNSETVYICGHDVSKIISDFFEFRLKVLGINAISLDLSDMDGVQNMLSRINKNDSVILIAFPKYYHGISNIAKYIAYREVDIITITDNLSSPPVQYSKQIFICNTSTKVFYNSLTLPMTLANLILSYIVIEIGSSYENLEIREN